MRPRSQPAAPIARGVTRLLSILTLWVPAYGIEGLTKGLLALVSVGITAGLLLLLPRGGRRSGPEPPGPDQGDDDQQAAHVKQGGEAERGSHAVGDRVRAGRVPARRAEHRHQHGEAGKIKQDDAAGVPGSI